MEKTINIFDSLLKKEGLGVRVYWSNDDKVIASNYNTEILAPSDKDGKAVVVDFLHFDLFESLYRFAHNGPTTHVSQSMPHLATDDGMFAKDPEISQFHKALREFSLGKEVMFFSEDGAGLTLDVVETTDFRTKKPAENFLKEIKADNLKDLLIQFEQFMNTRLEKERQMRLKTSIASEWSSSENVGPTSN